MTDRKVGPIALALMHHFEDCRLVAYRPLPTDRATIGWGMTYYPDGRIVKLGDRITQEQADAMLAQLLDRDFTRVVDVATGSAPTTPAQFGAMVALSYNIGTGPKIWLPRMKQGFRQSQVLKLHRIGQYDAAAAAFASWTRSGGKVVAGLVRRRGAKAALYLGRMAEVTRLTLGDVR